LPFLRNLSVVVDAVMVDLSEAFRDGNSNWEAGLWLQEGGRTFAKISKATVPQNKL
jgi:hypothetical protein